MSENENVFLVRDDEGGRKPKVLDFGIAKLLGASRHRGMKETAVGKLTPDETF